MGILPVDWGHPGTWGLDPSCSKGVTEGSWFPHEKEFKDRHNTVDVAHTTRHKWESLLKLKYILQMRKLMTERRRAVLAGVWVSIFY